MSRVIGLLLVDAQFAQWLSFGLEQQGYLVLRSEQPERDLHEPDDQVQAWRPDIWLASASLWRQARNSPLRHGKDARAEWHWLADTAGPASAPGLWPTEPRALLLRLHEYFSTRNESHAAVLQQGSLRIDTVTQSASIGHLPLSLSAQGLRLLQLFLQHPGRVFSRQQLLDAVWGNYGAIEPRSVDAQIYRLRRQLEEHGQGELLESVRGQGYRLRPDVRRKEPLPGGARFSL